MRGAKGATIIAVKDTMIIVMKGFVSCLKSFKSGSLQLKKKLQEPEGDKAHFLNDGASFVRAIHKQKKVVKHTERNIRQRALEDKEKIANFKEGSCGERESHETVEINTSRLLAVKAAPKAKVIRLKAKRATLEGNVGRVAGECIANTITLDGAIGMLYESMAHMGTTIRNPCFGVEEPLGPLNELFSRGHVRH
ncbi:hypothetical protein GUJ93_ZPchr0014g46735 [Zizania palustris]|uniref:Uncharacterized protein n=1 Tax=Zizania palustris TaxID=103762 RepID=A0A8J5SXL6_ZIZPA|nr:hypothetical protein GUJ93_ZPchr0014g46735 [Zizania palustris]